MAGVLTGIRVLDLSTIVAGPAASMILVDLGADIIKVERTGSGEDGRSMGPHRGSWGAYFTALNRGKRSIALDIRDPSGREAVLRIAATCDVFLENFRGARRPPTDWTRGPSELENRISSTRRFQLTGPPGPITHVRVTTQFCRPGQAL